MAQNPTIRDVARAAGVCAATASLALRNDSRLKKSTCEKVQGIAEQLGYRTNAVVSQLLAQLRTSRVPKYQATLGIINASENPGIMDEVPTFREWRAGYRERAFELGYGVDELWLHEMGMSPHRLASILHARNIHGVLVAACLGNGELPSGFNEIWTDFACVVIGVCNVRPLTHLACNDQYFTVWLAVEEALRLGYSRPALVINQDVDDLLNCRFSGAFLAAQNKLSAKQKVPPFYYRSPLDLPASNMASVENKKRFNEWLKRHQPDVILCMHTEIKGWVESSRPGDPSQVGLIHLDWSEQLQGWAGVNQNSRLVGAAGVDLLVGLLHRNELGIPSFPKSLMVESSWVAGDTVRLQEK